MFVLGKEVLQEVLYPLELSKEDLNSLYRRMYEHMIEAVDAIDNGDLSLFLIT